MSGDPRGRSAVWSASSQPARASREAAGISVHVNLEPAITAQIAIGATGMIYLAYILGNLAILVARFRGWPKDSAPFKLGQWGTIVNLLGLVWGIAMEVNFLWPRNAGSYPGWVFTTPPLSLAAGHFGLGHGSDGSSGSSCAP